MDRQQIRKELENILTIVDDKILQRVNVKEDTSIRDGLGLDSLQLTEMLFEVEERLGAKISDEEARSIQTVGDLINLIEAKQNQSQQQGA